MNPTAASLTALMYPTAAYLPNIQRPDDPRAPVLSWSESYMNPKNRIDSLADLRRPTWRIDGGEADGTRFFIVPDFAIGRPPLRIDVYIPDQEYHPDHLRDILQSDSTLLVEGKAIASLAISQHILRALHTWSGNYKNFESIYTSMPFGSRIIIENITSSILDMSLHLVPVHDTEEQWLSIGTLQALWDLPKHRWPEVLPFDNLQFQRQPHEAISLVQIAQKPHHGMLVFKSVLHDVTYLYHELKMLLSIEPHPNIMQRPIYVVTKKCGFGGRVGVCGFVLEYLPLGTLKDYICHMRTHKAWSLQNQLRLAGQLVSALIHINRSPQGFYSDLKLNNVMMSCDETGFQVKLIDFEQRSAWFSWSPPEVYYLEYFENLVSSQLAPDLKERFVQILKEHLPLWRPRSRGARYENSSQGYCTGWLALSHFEKELAQVFMLGKILWCIFEGMSTINSVPTVETLRDDVCDQYFPEFRHTPPMLRHLIKRCTAGAPEWERRYPAVLRKGNKLFPRGKSGLNGELEGTAIETQEAARSWWKEELSNAQSFLSARTRRRDQRSPKDIQVLAFLEQRLTLKEVLETIENVRLEAREALLPSDLVS